MKRVYIVCSGPSMKDFDFTLLKDYDTIVVNMSYQYVPDWNYMVAIDEITFDKFKQQQRDLSTIEDRVIYTRENYDSEIKIPYHIKSNGKYIHIIHLRASGRILESRLGLICSKNNSGYMAFSLAIQMGYKDIRILGMDLSQEGHFYDDEIHNYSNIIKEMNTIEKLLSQVMPDVKVYRYDNGDWPSFIKMSKEDIVK